MEIYVGRCGTTTGKNPAEHLREVHILNCWPRRSFHHQFQQCEFLHVHASAYQTLYPTPIHLFHRVRLHTCAIWWSTRTLISMCSRRGGNVLVQRAGLRQITRMWLNTDIVYHQLHLSSPLPIRVHFLRLQHSVSHQRREFQRQHVYRCKDHFGGELRRRRLWQTVRLREIICLFALFSSRLHRLLHPLELCRVHQQRPEDYNVLYFNKFHKNTVMPKYLTRSTTRWSIYRRTLMTSRSRRTSATTSSLCTTSSSLSTASTTSFVLRDIELSLFDAVGLTSRTNSVNLVYVFHMSMVTTRNFPRSMSMHFLHQDLFTSTMSTRSWNTI